MKLISIILLTLFPLFIFSQGKRVFGDVYKLKKETTYSEHGFSTTYNVFKFPGKYEIFLLKKIGIPTERKENKGTLKIKQYTLYNEPLKIPKYYNFNIYPSNTSLLKKLDTISKRKLKYTSSDSSRFSFRITKEELNIYEFVEFKCDSFLKIFKINDILNRFLYVSLNCNRYEISETQYEEEPYIEPKDPSRHEKPVIYLYPTKSEEIKVKLNFKGKVLNTYPEYNNGWFVKAEPDGKLFNYSDKRNYNYLFWDGAYSFPKEHFDYKSGFIVKRNEYISFLQNKLSLLGLNETEINDFIVYWLPQLNKNEQNFIHFWINDNIDNSAFLDIEPKPDTEIRVFMEFKKADKAQTIEEQKLPKLGRKGFTVVEWGGSEINSNKLE